MNFKYISAAILAISLLLTSCKKQQESTNTIQNNLDEITAIDTNLLIGSWKDQSKSALNFTLYSDGTAKSDNMTTLLYEHWFLKDNSLFLITKSIGNKQSLIDTINYSIQTLSSTELILKRGDLMFEYKKDNINHAKDDKSLSLKDSKILKGELILAHETRTFKPCGDNKTFWIIDKTETLNELYAELTKNKKPYTPIFGQIEITDKGEASEGFASNYESVYEITKILETRNVSDIDCK